jgi:hypothetical protein
MYRSGVFSQMWFQNAPTKMEKSYGGKRKYWSYENMVNATSAARETGMGYLKADKTFNVPAFRRCFMQLRKQFGTQNAASIVWGGGRYFRRTWKSVSGLHFDNWKTVYGLTQTDAAVIAFQNAERINFQHSFGKGERQTSGSRKPRFGDPLRWPRDTLYPQKLALTSPTSGGRSVGIVRMRTLATEFSFLFLNVKSRKELSIRKTIETFVLDNLVLKRVILTVFRRFWRRIPET